MLQLKNDMLFIIWSWGITNPCFLIQHGIHLVLYWRFLLFLDSALHALDAVLLIYVDDLYGYRLCCVSISLGCDRECLWAQVYAAKTEGGHAIIIRSRSGTGKLAIGSCTSWGAEG
jgi:hypothetical protein